MDGPRPRRGREKARAMRLTKRQASSNRQAILDATGRLLRMRGFDAVSVAGLMDEAGFTPAVAPPPTRSQGHADRYVIRHVGLTPPALSPVVLSPGARSFAITPSLPPAKSKSTGAMPWLAAMHEG
jgi:hypothetical protein